MFLLGGCAVCNTALAEGATKDEASILHTRLAFNQAIRERDLDGIARVLAPEYQNLTSRNFQSLGKTAEREAWAKMFSEDPSFVCQRDTREVRLNSSWGQAEELGNWRCVQTVENQAIRVSGVYAAKWLRTTGGRWLIGSEVFTALSCEGSDAGCAAPAPIGKQTQQ